MFTELDGKVLNLINVQSIKKTETLNDDGTVKSYDNTLTFQNGVKMIKSYESENARNKDYTDMSNAGSGGGGGSSTGMKYVIVQALPQTGEDNTIYLVPKSTSKTNNYYDEYMYISNNWERIGDTEIDLSNYQEKLVSGTNIKTINNESILGSGNLQIKEDSYLIKLSSNAQDIETDSDNIAVLEDIYKNFDTIDLSKVYLKNTNGTCIIPVYILKSGIFLYIHDIYNYSAYSTSTYGLGCVSTYVQRFMIRFNNDGTYLDQSSSREPGAIITDVNKILGTTNTTSYTPTKNYHPATKKYVDDSISSAITDALTGSY